MSRAAVLVRPHPPSTFAGGDMASPNDTRLPERFRAKFVVNKQTGCWEWTAYINVTGYGMINVAAPERQRRFRTFRAHRYSYEQITGRIPEELTIDHLCRVRHCVNPDHLEAVTKRVNVLRGEGPTAINARKTHCPQGHPFTGINLYSYGPDRRWRKCKQCHNERRARQR